MKKTKLLTSIAAFALVLGLGACETGDININIEGGVDTTDTDTSEETTSQSSDTTPSEKTAYALVGDFVDSDWDESPDTSSKYYIGADSTSYEVTVEIGSAPKDTDDWATYGPWNAGLRVVEYGTWNLALGYDELDKDSTGVLAEGDDKNIGVNWDATYNLTITLGDNPSILVKLVEDTYEDDPVADLLSDVKENNNYTLTIEYYDWTSPTYGNEEEMYKEFYADTITKNSERHYNVDITFTKDVMFIEYYYGLNTGSVYDIESYINNGDDMEVWWCTGTYSTTLAKQTCMTETNQSWQTKWKSETLLGIEDGLFVVDTDSYDGTKVDYTVNIDSYDTLSALVDCLYHCANYYADGGDYTNNISPFIYNLSTYWNTYEAPTVESTYDLEADEWDTTMYYLEESVNAVNQTENDYQLKYHGATAYITDVGSTELAEIYASQLPIYAA